MATQEQLDEHYGYLADTRRMALLRRAIQETVRPGDRVLDLGCGTGILGLFCLEVGAGHVTFLDETEMIDVAHRSMERAGHQEKCTFVKARSTEATLPERVDLIVCDNIGYFGIDYDVLGTLKDAKDRFLNPDGRVFPRRLRLFSAMVEAPEPATQVSRWTRPDIPDAFHWLGAESANYKWPAKPGTMNLLSEPCDMAVFTLGDDSPDFESFSSELAITKAGTAEGILGWFEAELTSDLVMTNKLGASDKIDRPQAFFPFDDGLPLTRGEKIKISIKVRPADHIWVWQADALDGPSRRIQSTMKTLTRQQLQLNDKTSPLSLTKRAEISKAVLALCDNHRTADEIEELVVRDHRARLPTEDALRAAIRRDLARFTSDASGPVSLKTRRSPT